jgi:hypothetical protein
MLYGSEIFKNHEYRKLSSFSQNSADQNANLKVPPTKSEDHAISEVEDFGLKVC